MALTVSHMSQHAFIQNTFVTLFKNPPGYVFSQQPDSTGGEFTLSQAVMAW